MLKDHGISMLPIDDGENNIISSALQSGRKLILSDAGKQLMLTYPKAATKTDTSNSVTALSGQPLTANSIRMENGAIKRKTTVPVSHIPAKATAQLKTNKVIKILSAEEFNKMVAGKMVNNTIKKLPTDAINNGAIRQVQRECTSNVDSVNQLNYNFTYRLDSLSPNAITNLAKVNNKQKPVMNKCKFSPVPAVVKVTFVKHTHLNERNANFTSFEQNTISNDVKMTQAPVAFKAVNTLQRVPKLNSVANANSTKIEPIASMSKKIIYKNEPPHLVISSPSTNTQTSIPPLTAVTTNDTNSDNSIAGANVSKSPQLVTISRTSLNDIMRQLFDLKKQTDDMKKQMDLYQKQSEECRIRLDKLEKERKADAEKYGRQYTNVNY